MNIVRPSAELLFITPLAEILIERAGRTCYKSEDSIRPESAPGFVRMLISREHMSMIEHASATIRLVTDRGVTHELVRHRLASYAQESTRYCDYAGGGIALIHPAGLTDAQRERREKHFCAVQDLYEMERSEGVSPQIARGVLPTCLKTEIVVTANFREWLHILELRTSAQAHPQMREVMMMVRAILQERCPSVFGTPSGGIHAPRAQT